jgi:hypothetical protein
LTWVIKTPVKKMDASASAIPILAIIDTPHQGWLSDYFKCTRFVRHYLQTNFIAEHLLGRKQLHATGSKVKCIRHYSDQILCTDWGRR